MSIYTATAGLHTDLNPQPQKVYASGQHLAAPLYPGHWNVLIWSATGLQNNHLIIMLDKNVRNEAQQM